MDKLVFQTQKLELSREDGGCALIGEVCDDDTACGSEAPSEVFVRIHSWDDAMQHPTIKRLEGKRVRVTVEVIEF